MTHPFDEFSKSLAEESVPRRESLRRMGAALIGALIGPLVIGAEVASASPDSRSRRRPIGRGLRRPGGKPKPDACTTFCSRCANKSRRNQCLSVCRTCNNDPRRLNGACGRYVCCGSGQTYCGGSCVDLTNDVNNCGACGNVCGGGTTCVNGTCTGGGNGCSSGQTRCNGTCVNLSSDNNNCGACGNVCLDGSTCSNGVCRGGGDDCGFGAARCNGVCINILSDSANCGACGVVCAADEICTFGACTGTCSGC